MKFESWVWVLFFTFVLVRCEGESIATDFGKMVKAYRETVQ